MTEGVLLQSISISDFSNENGVAHVSGFIAHEGVMNRQTFTKEELLKAAKSFIGRPIMKEHTKAVDEVVGKINTVSLEFDEKSNSEGLFYTGEIGLEHEKLINDIKREFVTGVSMRIGYEERPTHFCNLCGKPVGECSHDFSNPEFAPIATNFHGVHLAIVTEPADNQASITTSFSEDGQIYNDIEKFLFRRTNMSDLEKKYADLVDEFSEFKLNSQEEINKLDADFKAQKEALEADMTKKVEEYMNLKSEFDAISTEKENLEKKVKVLEEEFSKIEEERLSSLRKEVSDLNKEVYGNLTDEQINSFEESTLHQYVDLFSHQKEKFLSIKPEFNGDDQYNDDFEEKDPLSSLMNRLNL